MMIKNKLRISVILMFLTGLSPFAGFVSAQEKTAQPGGKEPEKTVSPGETHETPAAKAAGGAETNYPRANQRRSWFSFFGAGDNNKNSTAVTTEPDRKIPGTAGTAMLPGIPTEEEKRRRELEEKKQKVRQTIFARELEKKQLLAEIQKLKVTLLKDDPELRDLHKKIMNLHRDMALKMDKNQKMKSLMDQLENVDGTVKQLKEEFNILNGQK